MGSVHGYDMVLYILIPIILGIIDMLVTHGPMVWIIFGIIDMLVTHGVDYMLGFQSSWVVHVCDLFSQMHYLTCNEEQY